MYYQRREKSFAYVAEIGTPSLYFMSMGLWLLGGGFPQECMNISLNRRMLRILECWQSLWIILDIYRWCQHQCVFHQIFSRFYDSYCWVSQHHLWIKTEIIDVCLWKSCIMVFGICPSPGVRYLWVHVSFTHVLQRREHKNMLWWADA